jgi:GNAT superfamily N-acetyltransferase
MIRPYDAARDATDVLHLSNLATGFNLSLDTFLAQEAARPAEQVWARGVAEVEGRVMGLALLHPFDFVPPGWRRLLVSVEPEARKQGLGTALLAWAQVQALQLRVDGLSANVLDHDPHSRAWAERRGFVQHAHRFASQLDLSRPQPAPKWPVGVHLRDMVDAAPADWERLIALYGDLLMDTPDMMGQPRWAPEQLRAHTRDNPRARADWTLVAVSETGDWLGLCQGVQISTGIYNEFTGVVPAARGQGLARALKLDLIRRAQAADIALMRTNNHAANGPMLSVNRRLGFGALAGSWEMRLALAQITV